VKSSSKLAVVIMAAGKGTRLKSSRPKVLHEIGGMPLLKHVIATASTLVAPGDIYVVIGHQAEQVKAAVAETGVHFVEQTEQRGTGHAIQCCEAAIAGYDNILVLSGDVPLIRPETLEELWRFHQGEEAAMTILTAAPQNPTGYGRILRQSPKSAEVEAIVEQKDLTPEQESLTEINSGIYAFQTAPLLEHLGELTANNANGELYLTDMAGLLRAARKLVVALEAPEAAEVLGANTIADLVALDATLRANTAGRLMASGVTIFRPDTCVIDAEVEVAADTVIEPFVQLLGHTRIGAECLIRSYSVIENCTLGNSVLLRQSCILSDSTVADGALCPPAAGQRDRRRRPRGQLCGDQEGQAAQRGQGRPPHLPGRCRGGRRHQHRRRGNHLQLRRRAQAHHHDRQGRFCGQRFHAGGAGGRGGWGLYRGRLLHHQRRADRGSGRGPRPPGQHGRLGRQTPRPAATEGLGCAAANG